MRNKREGGGGKGKYVELANTRAGGDFFVISIALYRPRFLHKSAVTSRGERFVVS